MGSHLGQCMRIEQRQAHTLFGVAFIFLSGHALRIILNLHEAIDSDVLTRVRQQLNHTMDTEEDSDCASPWPFWTMVSNCGTLSVID